MEDFVNDLADSVVKMTTDVIAAILDWMSNFLLGTFNLNISESSGGILATIDEYFPMFASVRWVMVFIGITIAIMFLFMNFYRTLLHTLASDEVEHPFVLIVRFVMTVVLVFASFTICKYAVYLASYWYAAMWNTSVDTSSLTEGVFSGLSDKTAEVIGTNLVTNIVLAGPILVLFLMIAIGWNYLKLILESVERYVLIAILSYSSPIAFAAFGSRTTARVLAGWMRVYASQFLLLTLNVWLIRTFNQAIARFITLGGNAGGVSTVVSSGQSSVTINGTSLVATGAAETGSYIMFLIVLLALLIAAQRMDSYLASTGLNVAQTGSKLLGEAINAGRGIQTVINSTSRAMGSGSGVAKGSDMMRGSLVPVHTGQTAAAMAHGGLGREVTPNGNIQMLGGERIVSRAAADQNTGAVLGKIEDPGRPGSSTEVMSVPADLADRQSSGHYTKGQDGEPMKVMAQGPLAWEALSAIQTKPNANMPDLKDGAMAQMYNRSYNEALNKGLPDPAGYAKAKQDAFAAENGIQSDLQAHRSDVNAMVPKGALTMNGQEISGMEITPQEGKPGVYQLSGTAEDGSAVNGTLVDENVVGERSSENYPDAVSLTDENGMNQYSFLQDDPDAATMGGYGYAPSAPGSLSEEDDQSEDIDASSTPMFGTTGTYAQGGDTPSEMPDNFGSESIQTPLHSGAFQQDFSGDIFGEGGHVESIAQYGPVEAAMYNGDGIYTALTAQSEVPDEGRIHMTMEDANRYHKRDGDASFRGTTRADINGQERTFNVYAHRVSNGAKNTQVRPGKRKSFAAPTVRQTPRSGLQNKRSAPGLLNRVFWGKKR